MRLAFCALVIPCQTAQDQSLCDLPLPSVFCSGLDLGSRVEPLGPPRLVPICRGTGSLVKEGSLGVGGTPVWGRLRSCPWHVSCLNRALYASAAAQTLSGPPLPHVGPCTHVWPAGSQGLTYGLALPLVTHVSPTEMGLADITWPNRKTPLANFACRYPGLGAQTLPGRGPANHRDC